MKKIIKLDKALSLDKEIIAQLNDEQLGALEGGLHAVAGGTNSCDTGAMTTNDHSCNACSCN